MAAGFSQPILVEATEHRVRPILRTALEALGLIPNAREVWEPMRYAMIGGIPVGTLLTLVFLPALHVAWFRIRQPAEEPATAEPATA